MKRDQIIIEQTEQVKLGFAVFMEKIKRELPIDFRVNQIIIKNGEITVKE